MKSNYSTNYVKNLVTQTIATITGLLSLFIVVPFLTQDKVLYGVYSICISLTVFINYADLGLFSAGQKFSAECFARNDIDGEQRMIGFTTFSLLCFSLVVSLFLVPLAAKPELLISDIQYNTKVSTILISILICSVPFMIIKRISSLVFTIRIEQYKYNMIVLLAQLVKILSVFCFFRHGRYFLTEYYLFSQLVDAISTVLLLLYIVKKYNYGRFFLKNIRFKKDIWNTVKSMAFVSLFTTITWILYYELDLLVLAKIANPETVALYSTAFTLLTLSRNYFGIVYNSFLARYNHYFGLRETDKLKDFFCKNIHGLFPFIFFPILIFSILGSYFVTSWVGKDFLYSGSIARILILGSVFATVSYPSSQYLYSAGKIRTLYWVSALSPLVFWLGVVFSYSWLGILAFALFKALAQIISAIYSFFKACRFQSISVRCMIKELTKSYIFPTIAVIICCFVSTPLMQSDKGLATLGMNILIMLLVFLMGIIFCIFISRPIREYALLFFKNYAKKVTKF